MKKRYLKIDILKTLSILLMSFVHVNSLIYTGKGLLDSITYLGATVCFSIFLFATAYIQGKKIEEKKEITWKKLLKNILSVYIPYLFLGFLSILILKPNFVFLDFLKMAIFAYLPNYVEFLVSFIFFYLFAKFAYSFLKKYMEKPLLLILFAILSFTISSLLSRVNLTNPILSWVQIHLVGLRAGAIHSFPLLAYMPVYIAGILLSKYGNKETYLWTSSLSFLTLVILEALHLRNWYRWPPSLGFMVFGILFITTILFLLEFVKDSKLLEKISLLGRFPMLSSIFLTFFAFLLRFLLGEDIQGVFVWLLNILVLLLTYLSVLGISLSKKRE